MKIGELAKTADVTAKTVRFYEAEGLILEPHRKASGYRDYGTEDVKRLGFIRRAKSLGLSLHEIKDVLQAYDHKPPHSVRMRTLLDQKLAQADSAIRDLQGLQVTLEDIRAKI